MPSVAYATGLSTLASSLCVFTTTATGCVAVTVTAYCVPSMSTDSTFGSTNCDWPGAIVSTTRTLAPPAKGRDVAVAVVVAVTRAWLMHGVWTPKQPRTVLGCDDVGGPHATTLVEVS